MNIQKDNNVFVFDMDNTLIKTNKANNLAYFEAISLLPGVQNYDINYDERLTREKLKTIFPDLTSTQLCEIIARKEQYFESHIKETELNHNLMMLLKQHYYKDHHTILLTNSRARRAISLCNHYKLTKYFVRRFFYEDYCIGNKYTFLKSLGYDLQNIVLYENDGCRALEEAAANGINIERIIKIKF